MSCNHSHTSCCSGHHHHDNWPVFPPIYPAFPWQPCHPHRPWPQEDGACGAYLQPICASPAQYSDAGVTQGATLVIHKIVLEPCGDRSCTPRTYTIRITGPSYPCGETFQLRAGSCLELDEPLVITGLEPGTYCIEEVQNCPNAYISTFTGPVCGRQVTVTSSYFPTVITICSRKRLCRLCRRSGCGCGCH